MTSSCQLKNVAVSYQQKQIDRGEAMAVQYLDTFLVKLDETLEFQASIIISLGTVLKSVGGI